MLGCEEKGGGGGRRVRRVGIGDELARRVESSLTLRFEK